MDNSQRPVAPSQRPALPADSALPAGSVRGVDSRPAADSVPAAGRHPLPQNETWLWAPVILLITATIQYIGASIAVGLFASVAAIAVAWGRALSGSLMLLAWRRPHFTLATEEGRRRTLAALIYGLAIVSTNVVFYLALDRIPLGTTVALEFLGPVLLAAVVGRGWKVRAGIVLALIGVFLISWVGVDLSAPGVAVGVVCAVGAGVLWAIYMYMGRRVAVTGHGIESLALGMFIGALVWTPFVVGHIGEIFADWRILGLVILVGFLSSVVPYGGDAIIMARIDAGLFALLNSLLPAVSLLVGLVMLAQIPTAGELAGLVCITAAVALATYPNRRRSDGTKA